MANERKTEQIVRKHFEKFADKLIIEEQKSDNPIIDKLLKTASKKGTGKGYPEFIISFKENSELLIVVECKADVTKHESKNRVKYSEYAVDGVLLYASYLSKSFDDKLLIETKKANGGLKTSPKIGKNNKKLYLFLFFK